MSFHKMEIPMEKVIPMYLRNLIQSRCNYQRAFQPFFSDFGVSSHESSIGHLYKLSFQPSGEELEADLSVVDLENPDEKKQVVGIFESVYWSGSPDSNLELSFRVSGKNKAIIQEALCLPKEPVQVVAHWAIYDCFFPTGKYFKSFYMIEKPLVFGLQDAVQIVVNYAHVGERSLYEVYMPLIPKSEVPNQALGCVFRPGGKEFKLPLE